MIHNIIIIDNAEWCYTLPSSLTDVKQVMYRFFFTKCKTNNQMFPFTEFFLLYSITSIE